MSSLNNLVLTNKIKNIIPSLAAMQQVMKNLSDIMKISKEKERNLTTNIEDNDSGLIIPLESKHVEYPMPDLTGMSLRKSLRVLNDKKVQIRIVGSGVVIAQSPKPGTLLNDESICFLTLGNDVEKK